MMGTLVKARELFDGHMMIVPEGEFYVRDWSMIGPDEDEKEAGKFWVEGCYFDGLEIDARGRDFFFEPDAQVEVISV